MQDNNSWTMYFQKRSQNTEYGKCIPQNGLILHGYLLLSQRLFYTITNVHFLYGACLRSFSGGVETAYFSDSMRNATRLRLIAPGLHEGEKQARTRP